MVGDVEEKHSNILVTSSMSPSAEVSEIFRDELLIENGCRRLHRHGIDGAYFEVVHLAPRRARKDSYCSERFEKLRSL